MARIGQPVEEWEGVLPLISLTRSQNDRQRAPEPVGDHANFERRSVHLTEVYRQKDLLPAANYGRVVGVRTSGVLAQAALGPADASTGAA